MTQQYTGRNNVTISTPDYGSVPIVSQTEIEPIKTALSLMFALVTTTALTEPPPVPKPPGPGGSCPHGYIASGSFSARRHRVLRTPSRSPATARVGFVLLAKSTRAALALRAGSIQSPEFRTRPCLRVFGAAVDRCMNSARRQSRSPATKPLAANG